MVLMPADRTAVRLRSPTALCIPFVILRTPHTQGAVEITSPSKSSRLVVGVLDGLA